MFRSENAEMQAMIQSGNRAVFELQNMERQALFVLKHAEM